MKTTEFETAFCRYAKAHISLMLSHASAKPPLKRSVLETSFHEGGYRHSVREVPWYAGLPPQMNDTDFPDTLASECVKIGLRNQILPIPGMSDNAGRPITNPTFEQLKFYEFVELRWPIVSGFEKFGFRRLTNSELKSALKPYLNAWTARALPYITFSCLRNFDGEFKTIRLPEGSSIRRISDIDRNYLWNQSWSTETIPIRHFSRSPYFITAKYAQPISGPQPDFVSNIIEDAVTALRLLKPGDVGIDGLSSFPVLTGTMGGSFSPLPHLQMDHVFSGHPYTLLRRRDDSVDCSIL